MQTGSSGNTEKSKIENHAPGIYKVLGALLLDIGILGVFWFFGMILATAIWTLCEFISNAGVIQDSKPGAFALILISIPALYASILALWAWRGQQLTLKQYPTQNKKRALLAVATGFSMFLFTTACTYALNAAGIGLQPSNQALLEDIGKQTPVFIMLLVIMIAPVFEELFFRKQIFARLVGSGYVKSGYLISSLLFALMHEPLPTQGVAAWLLMLGLYGGMGATFAWLYRKTGMLWPAILAHAANNLFAVSALLIGKSMS